MRQLSEEQRLLVKTFEEIAEEEFAENACTWQDEIPWENLEVLADRGLLGINLPEEYGGGGMSLTDLLLQIETIGRICPDTGGYLNTISMTPPRSLELFGTEEAKERYLPIVTNAEGLIPMAVSEPQAGSDVQNMETHIEEAHDGELYLSGEKIWCTNFPAAEAVIVWAKFPDEGIGSVIVDADSEGIDVVEHYTNMAGQKQSHFFLEDVHVPEENVIIRGRDQFVNQIKSLNWERLGNASLSNATALCAFDKALEYAQSREQFGQPIADFQGIRWKLADMAKHVQAGRALTHWAIRDAEQSDDYPARLPCSIAKLYCAEHAEEVVSEALQIHGANGYQRGHPLEYLYRFVRGRRIGHGTDEIQKNGIASELLEKGLE